MYIFKQKLHHTVYEINDIYLEETVTQQMISGRFCDMLLYCSISTAFSFSYKKIKQFDTIVIARHVGPDPDAVASQIALRDSILLTFPSSREMPKHFSLSTSSFLKEAAFSQVPAVSVIASTFPSNFK